MCNHCAKHREAYRSYHLSMTNLGFDQKKDLRPKKKVRSTTVGNGECGDELDTSALNMMEVMKLLALAQGENG